MLDEHVTDLVFENDTVEGLGLTPVAAAAGVKPAPPFGDFAPPLGAFAPPPLPPPMTELLLTGSAPLVWALAWRVAAWICALRFRRLDSNVSFCWFFFMGEGGELTVGHGLDHGQLCLGHL